MTRLSLAALFALHACAPAWAEERSDKWQPNLESYAHMVPVDASPCEYEVTIYNYETDHVKAASGSLWVGDFHVGIAYWLNVGPLASERYVVYPPDGWIAIPSEIIIQDKDQATVQICRFVGF